MGVGSVALTIDPLCFIEITSAASEAKVTSVAINVFWVGILTSVVSQSGLVRALFAVGHICLVQVGLDHVRFRTEGRVVKVTFLSSEPIHLLLYEAAAAVELALCGASTRSSVVKLLVVRAPQASVVRVSFLRLLKAAVESLSLRRATQAAVESLCLRRATQAAVESLCLPRATQAVVESLCLRRATQAVV